MSCGASVMDARLPPAERGGSIPTAPLCKSEWIVEVCKLEIAQAMVRKYHYAGRGSNTRVYTFGLRPYESWLDNEIVAVSWWLPPTKTAGASVWPDDPQAVLALSRLVATPDAPTNSCSFLLRHSMRQIDRQRWPVLVTYADEWQGHTGAIYKAAGWIADGTTKPEPTYIKDGVMKCRKAGNRTKTNPEMLAAGYTLVGKFRRLRFVHVRTDLLARFMEAQP